MASELDLLDSFLSEDTPSRDYSKQSSLRNVVRNTPAEDAASMESESIATEEALGRDSLASELVKAKSPVARAALLEEQQRRGGMLQTSAPADNDDLFASLMDATKSPLQSEVARLRELNPGQSDSNLEFMAKQSLANPAQPALTKEQDLEQRVARHKKANPNLSTAEATANEAFNQSLQQKFAEKRSNEGRNFISNRIDPIADKAKTKRDNITNEQAREHYNISQASDDMNPFVRGLAKGFIQGGALTGGAAAYFGDLFGSEDTRKTGMEIYDRGMRVVQAMTKAKELERIESIDDAATWLTENGGYVAYQAAESILAGGLGGAIGKTVGKEAAMAAGTLAANNLRQTLGAVYGDAVEESRNSGKPMPHMARIMAGAVASAAIDSVADVIGLKAVKGAAGGFTGNMPTRIAKSLGYQLGVQGGTEAAQLIPEDLGAGKDPFRAGWQSRFLNEGAVGALGGVGPGIVGGIYDKQNAPFQDFAEAVEGTNFNPDATARDAMLDQVQSIDPRLTRIAQAEQTKAAAQQAIATAPTIDAAVDAFNVATAAGSSSMVDQSQLLNDVNGVTNAAVPEQVATQETQANDAQVGAEQAAAPLLTVPAQPTTTKPLDQTPVAMPIPKEIASGQSVESLRQKMEAAEPFTEESAILQERLQLAVTADAVRSIRGGSMPVYQVSQNSFVTISPSAQNPGKFQVTRYNNKGVFGDSQYNTIEEAIRSEGLWVNPRLSEADAGALLQQSLTAESEFQSKKSEPTKQQKPKKDSKAVYPESDSALVAIAKLGGMDTQQLLTNGFDQSDISVQKGARVSKKTGQLGKAPFRAKQVGFNMPIHRNGGMSFDGMREALVQYGYLPEDASVNDAIDLLRRELRGEPVYTASAIQAQAEAAEADRQAMLEAEQAANEQSGYDELESTAEERAADALIAELHGEEIAELARGMRVAGLTEEEINAEIEAFNQRTGAQDGAGQSQERSGEGRAEESGTDAEVFGGKESAEPDWLKDDFGLEGQTNEEAAAEYKQQQAEANKQEAEPPAKNVTVDQVDIFNEQGGLRFSKAAQQFDEGKLTKATFEEGDNRFETGVPVTFKYLHNKQSATKLFGIPDKDSPYDRGYEPSGKYVTITDGERFAADNPKQFESGILTFENPLVLSDKNWKRELSAAFGGLTGKRLSQAVIAAGYDGVVTIGKYGTSETLDLTSFDARKAKYSKLSSSGKPIESEALPQQTAERLIARELGSTTLAKVLVDSGIVSFVNRGSQFQGATFENGNIVLNLDALTEQNFAGVFKHEGWHSTVRELVGEETWNQLMSQLEQNLKAAKGNDWVTRANAAIPADTKASDRTDELAAYSIEQVTNGAKVPNFIKRWVDSLLSAIRTALIRGMGGEKAKLLAMKHLKPQDLANLAIAGLKAKARNELASQGRAAMAYSAKDLDGGKNGKGRGFWDVLRARGEGFRGVYPGSTVQALSVRKRSRKAAANLGRYREDDSTTVIRWNDKVAGFDGYYSFGVPYNGAFATYFVPANRFTDIDDALLSDDFLRENAFFSIGFSFKPDGYELHVSDPVNGSSIFNEMLADGRLKPTEDYSSDGSHHYHAVQFDDKRDLPMLMSEAVRRLAIHIGKAPERVYSNGRDTGVNKERPRDYNADQIVGRFSTAFGPESQHRTPLGDITEIEVDGVKRPALNSNGKPIHWSREGVESFWRWFSDSHVVDDQGRPLVVYHGTTADIEAFDLKRSGEVGDRFADAAFFTSSPTIAAGYAQRLSKDEEHSRLVGAEDALRSQYGKAVLEQFQATGKTAGEISDPIKAEYDAAVNARRARRAAVFNNEVAIGGANIVPVYLRIDQPVDIDAAGGFYFNTHQQAFDDAVDSGADGVVVRNVIDRANEVQGGASDVFAVFNPTQIKSATGNNGDFDGSNPDIRYSKASPAQPAPLPEETRARAVQRNAFSLPEWTKTDTVQERIQDRYNRIRDVVKAIRSQGLVSDLNNFDMGEDRFHGVAMAKIEAIEEDVVSLLKSAKAADVTLEEVTMYAYAEHAPERNAAMQAINPNVKTGSGMSDQESAAIIAKAKQEGKDAALAQIADNMRTIARKTLKAQLDAGLIEQSEYDNYTNKYQKWVPLRGFETIDEEGRTFRGTGKGFNIRGKENLRALGRDSKAGQILENIVMDAERTAIRSTKNVEVNHRFLKFVMDNPDANLWEIDATKTKQAMKNGRVSLDSMIDKGANTIGVKVKGQVVYVKIHDQKLFEQLANMWDDNEFGAIPYLGEFSRYLSKSYTAWSPEFALYTNPIRDIQAAVFSITGREGVGMTKNFVKAYPKALKMAYQAEALGKDDPLYAEYKAMGGKTGFWNHNTLETKVKEIESLVKDMEASPGKNPLRYSFKMLKSLETLISNQAGAFENATRFAAYIAMRDAGRSKQDAAAFAKNLNVNFNRRGTWSAGIGSVVLFFNPAIQGIHNQYETLVKGKHKKQAWALMAAHFGAMAALAMLNAAGGEDDDGVKWWDKIPDYEKERNVILVLPSYMKTIGDKIPDSTGRYLKIPMPYQWNIGGYAGTLMADSYRNSENPAEGTSLGKAALLLSKATATAYMPVTGMPPTIAPIYHHVANKKPIGEGQLYPESQFNKHKPDSEKYLARMKDTPWQQWAEFVNEATGGNKFKEGLISIPPAAWKNYVRNYLGGPMSFANGIYDAVNDGDVTKAPFIRKAYGEVDFADDADKFYESTKKPVEAAKSYKDALKSDPAYARTMRTTEAVMIKLGNMALNSQERLGAISKDDIRIKDRTDLSDSEKRLKLKMNDLKRSNIQEEYLKEQKRVLGAAAVN